MKTRRGFFARLISLVVAAIVKRRPVSVSWEISNGITPSRFTEWGPELPASERQVKLVRPEDLWDMP